MYPNIAKAGGCKSRGAKGDAAVISRTPLAKPDNAPSDFCKG